MDEHELGGSSLESNKHKDQTHTMNSDKIGFDLIQYLFSDKCRTATLHFVLDKSAGLFEQDRVDAREQEFSLHEHRIDKGRRNTDHSDRDLTHYFAWNSCHISSSLEKMGRLSLG